MGDSKVDYENVMGKHGLSNMIENGELFADLCSKNDLVIGGTLFPHKNIHKATWLLPDSNTQNQIDHIAISKK